MHACIDDTYWMCTCVWLLPQIPGSAGTQPHTCSSLRRRRTADPHPDKWLCHCEAQHTCLLDLGLLHQPGKLHAFAA